ncbi:MAG: 4'-phosphopantetheinyl transferase superfamily protein [Nevskia sp.]|nr:4'-phosphopantetheinyl transferase superfamily protein [Nevskia sp.]
MPPAATVRCADRIAGLFPPGAVAFELSGDGDPAALHPLESREVEGSILRRRQQFAAGRACAKAALAELGMAGHALCAGPDRKPCWPAGAVGSISHTHAYCVAVAAPAARFRALGIDVEIVARVSARIREHIATPAERAWLETLGTDALALAGALLFSAKEAYYKCWSGAGGNILYFQDVELHAVDFAGGSFLVRLTAGRAHAIVPPMPAGGRFAVADGRVTCGVAAPAP